MPGWNEHAAPLRDKSILWHDIWVECGRLHEGIVASMRRTRASYHYAVRYSKNNKRNGLLVRYQKIEENFWLEAKKVCGGKSGLKVTLMVSLNPIRLLIYLLASIRIYTVVLALTKMKWPV